MSGRDRAAQAFKKPKQQAKTPQTTNTLITETLSPVEAIAKEIHRLHTSTASPGQILNLQRQLGNRATMGLLARKYDARMVGGRRKFVIRRQAADDNERLTPDNNHAHEQPERVAVMLRKSGDAPVARKHLMSLDTEAWTGRTGKPEKKALYEAIQQRIDMYNSTPPGKTAKDLSFDLMHLQFLETDITKWIREYGASETRGGYVNGLLTAVQAEAQMVAGKLAVAQRAPVREEAPVAVPEGVGGGDSKAGGSPPPMAPRPSPERVRELRDVVSPPSPVPKSGDVAPTPPQGSGRERRGPPPLPSVVPTGVTPTPVTPVSSSSSSSPAMGSVAKLRQQMEAQMDAPEAPREERKTPLKIPKFGGGGAEPMSIGSVVPVVSGSGTNLQNAIETVHAAWHSGRVPMDGLSEGNAFAIGALVNQLYADREVMVSHPPPASEQIRILELVRTIGSGDAGAIRRQLATLQLDDAVDDEEKKEDNEEESKGPAPSSYLGKQNAKLRALDQEAADQVAIQGASKFSASLKTGVQVQKAVTIGKVVAKTGVSVGLSQVPGAGQAYSLVLAVNQVRSTLKHMGNLKKIRAEIIASGGAGQAEMLEDLDYILSKKKAKAVKSGVGGVPGVGTVKTGAYAIKGLVKKIKGTAGKHRQEVAERLVAKAIRQDVQAKMVILELVGEDNYIKTIHAPNGPDLLAAKMKSQ